MIGRESDKGGCFIGLVFLLVFLLDLFHNFLAQPVLILYHGMILIVNLLSRLIICSKSVLKAPLKNPSGESILVSLI